VQRSAGSNNETVSDAVRADRERRIDLLGLLLIGLLNGLSNAGCARCLQLQYMDAQPLSTGFLLQRFRQSANLFKVLILAPHNQSTRLPTCGNHHTAAIL